MKMNQEYPVQANCEKTCYDSREEKEMVARFIIDAIDKLKEGTIEEQIEARNFIFHKDHNGFNAFSFWIDHIFGFNYDVDPEVAIKAIKKQLEEYNKNGKAKNNDGRRIKTTTSCNNDKHTRDSEPPKESLWLEIIFG